MDTALTIYHQNIQHLPSRIDLLEITVDELKPELIILNEHKMADPEIINLNIPNYTIHSTFCRKLTSGGGVMILGKNGINFDFKNVVSPQLNATLKEKEFEFCAVEYKNKKMTFVLVGIYRSPNSCVHMFFEKLSFLIHFLYKKYKHIIIVGDINIDVLVDSSKKKQLIDLLYTLNMTYLVDFPTRFSSTNQAALDNVLTNI